MSEKQNIFVLPGFFCKGGEEFIRQHPSLREFYENLPEQLQQILIDFFTNRHGSKITYDTVFKKLFDPYAHPDRLEAVLSAILGHSLKIVQVLPREGTHLSEQASFVIMDVLVRLNDNSFANVEIQKIGYLFPLARADCYASDLILRQYTKGKAEDNTKAFNFEKLHKVYCIVLMENSPSEFHGTDCYVHRRRPYFDSGIFPEDPGLHEDIFVCLDSFRSVVHNITKDSSELDAWLWFLCAVDAGEVEALVKAFPQFTPIYRELFDFMRTPKELMKMLSEALYIMDKNTERLMVTQLQEEVEAARAEVDAVTAERDAAVAEADAMAAERDAAVAEADAMTAELQKLRAYAVAHGYHEDAVTEP